MSYGMIGGVTAWGFEMAQKVKERMTPRDALVRGGYDFDVEKIPAMHPETGDNIPGVFYTIREDTREVLGVVGDQYKVYQHREMFDLFGELVQDDSIEVVHALHYRNYRRIALVAKLPEHIEVAGEEIIPYLVGETSHDGSVRRRVVTTPVRVVCRNTLALALASPRVYSAKHTSCAPEWTVQDVRAALEISFKYTEELKDFGDRLLEVKISDWEFERFLKSLVPTPGDVSQQTRTRRENQREEIRNVYHGSDNLGNIKGTGWGVLNGVVEWADHVRDFRSADRRAEIALEGDPVSERAKTLLLALS